MMNSGRKNKRAALQRDVIKGCLPSDPRMIVELGSRIGHAQVLRQQNGRATSQGQVSHRLTVSPSPTMSPCLARLVPHYD